MTVGTDTSNKLNYIVRMSQTYTANFIHCVFSTRDRRDLIPKELQERFGLICWAWQRTWTSNCSPSEAQPTTSILLINLPPTLPLAQAVQKLKANSSRWLGEHKLEFEWQKGYGAFSVSPSQLTVVQAYIRNQEEHHRKRNFEEELAAWLCKSGVSDKTRSSHSPL